jgi:ketosteroid isomerase-like protein
LGSRHLIIITCDETKSGGEVAVESAEDLLRRVYAAFNARELETTLAGMQPDVEWPNGMEGGTVYGHDGVRQYWTRQWGLIDPYVEPVRFHLDGSGRVVVGVHQVVHDLAGKVLVDQMIEHIYTIENGLIRRMEIHKLDGAES